MNLKEELDQVKAKLGPQIPPEIMEVFGKAGMEIAALGIPDKAPKVGDDAIDFTLPNVNGEDVSLSAAWAKGPVNINFFRGSW